MTIRLKPRTSDEPLDQACVAAAGACEESYRILDRARLPIAVMEGAQHMVCYANHALCHLLDKRQAEVIGKPFAEVLPDGEECLSQLDLVYRTGQPEAHIGQVHAAPDARCWSYEIWPVLTEPAGHPSGVVIELTETGPLYRRATAMNEALLVSAVRQHERIETTSTELQAETKERKLAEEALIRSELLANAGRLAASIAHEINNPLASVMNTLYLARTTAGLPETARKYLEIADGELRRIAHITRQTLGFYRESSAATSNSAAVLIGSVVDLLQAKVRSSGAVVEQRCDPKLEVTGVSGELRQVLANLLANSLDAVEPGERVVLRASVSFDPKSGARRARITVADNGRGIQSPALPKIFEPFFTTKGVVGTGLGLWVSKQLIDKCGGSIRVRSNTGGRRRGTTFSIVLPNDPVTPGSREASR